MFLRDSIIFGINSPLNFFHSFSFPKTNLRLLTKSFFESKIIEPSLSDSTARILLLSSHSKHNLSTKVKLYCEANGKTAIFQENVFLQNDNDGKGSYKVMLVHKSTLGFSSVLFEIMLEFISIVRDKGVCSDRNSVTVNSQKGWQIYAV